jgi:hypothetical protein
VPDTSPLRHSSTNRERSLYEERVDTLAERMESIELDASDDFIHLGESSGHHLAGKVWQLRADMQLRAGSHDGLLSASGTNPANATADPLPRTRDGDYPVPEYIMDPVSPALHE